MRNSGLLSEKTLAGAALLLLTAIMGGMVWSSCGCSRHDWFASTDPSFRLDKDAYSVGDTITLTFELRGESEVRFYENIENTLHVWLSLRVPYLEGHTAVTQRGIDGEQLEKRGPGKIDTYKLEKGRPLVMSFRGYVHETEDKEALVIVFPELNARFTVHKREHAKAIALEIHGYLMPINPHPLDSLEDYVTPVRLYIQA
jgi:hypothetical protein